MSFYSRHILPRCLDMACRTKPIRKQREKVIPQAQGRVVEIGMGSCANLPFYDVNTVSEVIGVEPDPYIWKQGEERRRSSPIPVEQIGLSGESLPLENDVADTVVVTYSLCTIPEPVKTLCEMRRVLKSGGRILFCEHGRAPDKSVAKWQTRIDPVWKHLVGGCHLGRDIPALIHEAGLTICKMDSMYIPGPKILSFNYWGVAA
ncbi:MAG: methyltransferase domain-containing protein [Hyphomonadaceae bacterium]|nr:methyltransferase domain-containing protein [Hyphomonadaceae bacterium]